MVMSDYTWIFVVSIIIAFIAAFGIGANDLANSFGSSVGTKALRMWQCVIIAGFCEFLGAFFLGASVTDTIKSGITNVKYFQPYPQLFLYGFFAVLCAAAFWDNFACHLELPVSTTHTTVGAIIGMSLVIGGGDAVVWSASSSTFPYFKGFAAVVASWFMSPIAAFIVVSIVWIFMRPVMRSRHSFVISFWLLPLFVWATISLITAFIIQVGGKNGTWSAQSDGTIAWICIVVGAGCALITLVCFMPFIKKRAISDEAKLQERVTRLANEKDAEAAKAAEEGATKEGLEVDGKVVDDADADATKSQVAPGGHVAALPKHGAFSAVDPELLHRAMYDVDHANEEPGKAGDWTDKCADAYHKFMATKFAKAVFCNKVSRTIGKSLFYDVHECVRTDERVARTWANAEVFDYKTERLYRYLQVFSAMAMSFAHGSNDVANAMGPLSAIYYTWDNSAVPSSKTPVPSWILALGGAGIVCGLATYGYKIMRVLGVKSVKLTNVRGFIVEWSTALVVVLASRFGLPVSTTQTVSGAILSIGLWEGRKGVNWRVAIRIFFGWVLTVFVACGISALITALGVFTPSMPQSKDILSGSNIANNETAFQLVKLNVSATATNDATLQAVVKNLTANLKQINSTYYRFVTDSTKLQAATFAVYDRTFVEN